MLISSTYSTKKIYNYPSFRNKALPQNALREMTLSRLNSTRNLYQKITELTDKFTQEGIKNLENIFPVTLGKALIFHECGKYKTSIAIIISNSRENKGMMRIIERKGRSKHWGDSIVINSFVMDKKNMLLKNYKENNTNTLPPDRIYLTDKEIADENFDKRLEGVLIDLQNKMLEFIEQLGLEKNQILKPDIALLPKNIIHTIKKIPKHNEAVNDLLSSIPKKLGRECRDSYPHYKFRPTTNIHTFQNLGDENVTIAYAPFRTSFGDNLSRMYVWDQYGNVKDSFTIEDNSKMIINTNRKDIRRIPRKLEYANESQLMQDENLPTFIKYLNLYAERLLGLKKHMILHIKKKAEKKDFDEIPKETQAEMKSIIDSINAITERLKALPKSRVEKVKQSFERLDTPHNKKGIAFKDEQTGKSVYVLPLNHVNGPLFRLTITEKNGKEKKYLVKDCKYIVKNYNTKRAKFVPETLIYMSKKDLEKINIIEDLRFFKEKIFKYEEHVSKELNNYLNSKFIRTSKHQ